MSLAIVSMLVLLSSCGGGVGADSADGSAESGESGGRSAAPNTPTSDEELADALGAAMGAGGGGVLMFDGEEIPIDSAFCAFHGDAVDVGTISETGHRVLLGTNNPANPISVQILDAEFRQWFPQGVSGDEAQREGNTFSSAPTPYFNNTDDRVIEASFTVECP